MKLYAVFSRGARVTASFASPNIHYLLCQKHENFAAHFNPGTQFGKPCSIVLSFFHNCDLIC